MPARCPVIGEKVLPSPAPASDSLWRRVHEVAGLSAIRAPYTKNKNTLFCFPQQPVAKSQQVGFIRTRFVAHHMPRKVRREGQLELPNQSSGREVIRD
jgi:hypothetical protein